MTSVAEAAKTGARTIHLIGDTDENETIVTMVIVAEMSEGRDVKNEELDEKGESDENEENAGKNGSGTGMRSWKTHLNHLRHTTRNLVDPNIDSHPRGPPLNIKVKRRKVHKLQVTASCPK